MDFGEAIKLLKEGKRVQRRGWNGKGIFIELQRPDENSKMTHPYIYIDTTGLQTENEHAPKNRVPWIASQTDMLAEDWKIAESNENKNENEIDIQKIEKYNVPASCNDDEWSIWNLRETVNKVIDAVKKIDNEMKKRK